MGKAALAPRQLARASLPQPLEAATGDARVVDGVAGIAMAEIVLHGPEVGAPVGEVVAA